MAAAAASGSWEAVRAAARRAFDVVQEEAE